MKHTRIFGKIALIALAAVCLLAVPALSMPMGDGSCRSGQGGMFDLKNNLTPEELNNMTLGEIKEMRKEAVNQSQSCPIMGKGQNSRNGENFCQMRGRDGAGGEKSMRDGSEDRADQMRMGDGSCQCGHGGMFASNNLTAEELENMTLGEIKEMRKEAMNQSQSGCPAMGVGQCCAQTGRDGPGGQMMGRDEPRYGRSHGAGSDNAAPREMFKGNTAILLMDDLNMNDLANMTLKQVEDLIQTKMQELDNMTLSQIKQLQKEKMQKNENLTLSQLKEENKNRQEMAGILSLAAVRPH